MIGEQVEGVYLQQDGAFIETLQFKSELGVIGSHME